VQITHIALVDFTLMQKSLVREVLRDQPGVEIVDAETWELADAQVDAVLGSASALGEREVRELLEHRPHARVLVVRGDFDAATLYALRLHHEDIEELSCLALRRAIAWRSFPQWHP
jgi:hypothetical protein